ncbi:methionyl-tRNA formyltransferase [Octadecabacter temperatus]|uniref:Methionyl-tRNA formyltransferase n=1 Tax=Octadecabacter temperatus TaxID=1458307 RepID=A0A0K0Y1F0_9RHOB|nr:methionyl-tRNA formyltransferase [Octadecabacter temperatus]AKS44769.1 Methionyl-tRNA formyltransferase [Octadecabacter temperatus]SIO35461.1 methionyl-tRNA formyltransferase [Octadecabacter temperatus]
MRIVFMGTPDFSVPILDALVEAGHVVCAVYSQPPRPAGRGKKDRPSSVQSRAEALGLQVRHPVSLRTDDALADFTALNADIAVVVAYGLILPQAILDAPTNGCLNIHASLLPRWRGAAPIHRAIMAGDAKTGVCIMQMEAGLDAGAVLLRREADIGETETTGALHDRLSGLGASAIVDALNMLSSLTPETQPEDGVTYAAKIDKAEARVDWTETSLQITRQINGLSPFPGAWSEADGERIKFLHAGPSSVPLAIGEVSTNGGLHIGTSDGAVQILTLQRAGKKAASAGDVLQGWTPPSRLI